MKRETVLRAFAKELKMGGEYAQTFQQFTKENEELNEHEFYLKFKQTYPWFEMMLEYNRVKNLNRIENHLFFVKVIIIISLILTVIAAIFSLANI